MRISWMALLLLAACAARPGKLVDRAVDATGGEEALASVTGYLAVSEGTYQGMPYKATVQFREPYDWRWDMESAAMSMSQWVLGPDRDTYMAAGGQTIPQSDTVRREMVKHVRMGNAALMPHLLLEHDVSLEKADPVEIDGVDCPALMARFGDSEPATFVFDPDTHRVRRVTFMMTDYESGKRGLATMDLGDFEEFGGIFVPRHTYMVWGEGDQGWVIDERLLSFEWNPTFADDAFEAPEAVTELVIEMREEPETLIAAHTFVGPYDQVGEGIGKVMAWIQEHGLVPSGSVALIYKGPPPADMTQAETYIQVPVTAAELPPRGGDVRLLRRKAFDFVYALYEGPASGCHLLFASVDEWCRSNGYRRTGPWRVHYLSMDEATGNCAAEVGFPARPTD